MYRNPRRHEVEDETVRGFHAGNDRNKEKGKISRTLMLRRR